MGFTPSIKPINRDIDMHDMQSSALNLFNSGLKPTPVLPEGKQPALKDWPNKIPTREILNTWIEQYPTYGVGILCEFNPTVDVDILDDGISKKMNLFIRSVFSGFIPIRTGLAPKFAIPCLSPKGLAPFTKQKTGVYADVNDKMSTHAVEILATGQMCVMNGIHPSTKQPYKWTNPPTYKNMATLTQRSIDQIFKYFEKLAQEKVLKGEWRLKSTASGQPALGNQSQNTSPVKARTKPQAVYTEDEQRDALNYVPKLDHDNWVKIGMGLHWQNQGDDLGKRLWKYYSKKMYEADGEYNEHEIDQRYPTFNTNGDTNGCSIGTVLQYKTKAIIAENTPTFISEDINKARVNDKLKPAKWYDNWYFLTNQNRVYNVISKATVLVAAFNQQYISIKEEEKFKATPLNEAMKLRHIASVDNAMYRPDVYTNDSLIGVYNNQTFVNTYSPYIPVGSPKDDGTFEHPICIENYFLTFIPNVSEREIVINYLAYIVQNPGNKVHWSPLLLGVEGSGKTTIYEIMKSILGGTNTQSISAKDFTSDFNEFVEGSLFTLVEEVSISGSNRYSIMDKVKELITNDSINVNKKGASLYKTKNVTSYMLATNHPDALPISDTNRRYCVIQTDMSTDTAITQPMFDEIYKYLASHALHIKHWFMNMQIKSDFRPKGRAPLTDSTKTMINNTKDIVTENIEDTISQNKPLINPLIVSLTSLVDVLYTLNPGYEFDTNFKNKVRSKLLKLHYVVNPNQRQIRVHGKKHTIYVPNLYLSKKLKINDIDIGKAIAEARK